MKPLFAGLAGAFASLPLAVPAHAERDCGPMHFFVGEPGRNPVAHTTVAYDAGVWTVIHHMQDGRDFDRSAQYSVTDISGEQNSVKAGVLAWAGMRKQPGSTLQMYGWLANLNGHVVYQEAIYDTANHNKVVGKTAQDCGPIATPAVTQASPPAAAGAPFTVPMVYSHGAALVAVQLGALAATMAVDTGANVMTVNATLADALIAHGDATPAADITSWLADGSVVTERSILISRVTIGGRDVGAVTATVNTTETMQLLPLPVLSRLGKFTIDSANQQLTFN